MSEAKADVEGQNPKTYKLATTSLVLGFFGAILFIFNIIAGGSTKLLVTAVITILVLAVILGIISTYKIIKSKGQLKGKDIAISGIVFSTVLLILETYIITIAMALGSPGIPADMVICGTNLARLGKSMSVYAGENDGKYPTANKWCDLLIEHVNDVIEGTFVCPSAGEGRCHYAMNPNCQPNSPPDMVLLFETKGGWNQFGGMELLTFGNHKPKGCHILLNDKSINFVRPKRLRELKWKVEEKH